MNISRTTVFGVLYSAVTAVAIDWVKLFAGDRQELAKLAGAIIIGFLGKYSADAPKSQPGETEKRETKGVAPGEDPLKGENLVVLKDPNK